MNKYDKMLEINKQASKEKISTAQYTIRKMLSEQERITIPKLVKKTGLSRGFFYKNEAIRAEVDRAVKQQAGMSDPRKGILDKAMEGRIQQMQILVAELRKENENLKSENQRLQKSLAKKELNVMKNLL